MKKRPILFALMMTLLLAGCAGRREAEELSRWRGSLRGREIAFTGEIESLAGEETFRFTAAVTARDGAVSLTVESPETIRGVSVTTDDAGRTLRYGELTLDLTPGRPEALSPCVAPALLLGAVGKGQVLWTGREATGPTAALTLTGAETVSLWRDEAGTPLYAEIARDGKTEITIRISDWNTKE